MDLDALLSALQATQQTKSSVRLSERNVVELISKLKQLGLFGEELMHTINGKEVGACHSVACAGWQNRR